VAAAAAVVNDSVKHNLGGNDNGIHRELKTVLRTAGVEETDVRNVTEALVKEEIDAEVLRECAHQDLMGVPGLTSKIVGLIRAHFQNLLKSDTPNDPAQPHPNYCCPMTRDLFRDPVFAEDGETYERQAIEDWIAEKQTALAAAQEEIERGNYSQRTARIVATGIPSPLGHGPLPSLELTCSRAMLRLVDRWRGEHPGW
jgi:hypothetical protein